MKKGKQQDDFYVMSYIFSFLNLFYLFSQLYTLIEFFFSSFYHSFYSSWLRRMHQWILKVMYICLILFFLTWRLSFVQWFFFCCYQNNVKYTNVCQNFLFVFKKTKSTSDVCNRHSWNDFQNIYEAEDCLFKYSRQKLSKDFWTESVYRFQSSYTTLLLACHSVCLSLSHTQTNTHTHTYSQLSR